MPTAAGSDQKGDSTGPVSLGLALAWLLAAGETGGLVVLSLLVPEQADTRPRVATARRDRKRAEVITMAG